MRHSYDTKASYFCNLPGLTVKYDIWCWIHQSQHTVIVTNRWSNYYNRFFRRNQRPTCWNKPIASLRNSAVNLAVRSFSLLWLTCRRNGQYHTSSLAILMSSLTSEKTVGCMKYPLSPCRSPPHSSFAPSFFPLSIRSRILLNCSSSTYKRN